MNRFFCPLLLVFLFFISCFTERQEDTILAIEERELKLYDSLSASIKNSIFRNDSLENRISTLETDSLRNALYFKYVYFHYTKGDSLMFRKWNKKTFLLSAQLRDTSRIAEAHWDLANFLHEKKNTDSAFYHYTKALNYYNIVGDQLRTGMMLLNLAVIQRNIKDYSGSEVTTIQAIRKFRSLENHQLLYEAYNNLGIIYNGLGEYDQSLEYHKYALRQQEKFKNSLKQASSLNNIGVVNKNRGRLPEAISTFRKALSFDSLYNKDPELYAMLLDNLAHAQLLTGDTTGVKNDFENALQIRDSLNYLAGVTINKLHLGEYYLRQGDTVLGVKEVKEALSLSKEINNHRDLLSSLLFLSKTNRTDSNKYLIDYINLNDSLQRKERAVRNKFARIKFETDEFIAQTENLTEQRKWIIGGSAGILSMIVLLFVVWRQKARNKELQLEKEQQQANEDIYKLLLDQERKLEEGRSLEKERISKELHDGVLGTMYGVRFNLSNLNEKVDRDSLEVREKLLKRLQEVEEEIRLISRDLQNKSVFGEISFLNILDHLLEARSRDLGFKPIIYSNPEIVWNTIDNRLKMNLYRIVQEALQNIVKYAEANQVFIRFEMSGKRLVLMIQDNGRGFDITRKSKGIGLRNIKSRALDLRGKVNIQSCSQGTTIKIKLPL